LPQEVIQQLPQQPQVQQLPQQPQVQQLPQQPQVQQLPQQPQVQQLPQQPQVQQLPQQPQVQQLPQQSQVQQEIGVKKHQILQASQLHRPTPQHFFQQVSPMLPLSPQQQVSQSPSKVPQIPKELETPPPPTETPTTKPEPSNEGKQDQIKSSQPTKGKDPLPAPRPSLSPNSSCFAPPFPPPGTPFALNWYPPFKGMGPLRSTTPPIDLMGAQQQKFPERSLPQAHPSSPKLSEAHIEYKYQKPLLSPVTPAATIPELKATTPNTPKVQTSYWPDQNKYPSVSSLDPNQHPSPQIWHTFLTSKSSSFNKGVASNKPDFLHPKPPYQYPGQSQNHMPVFSAQSEHAPQDPHSQQMPQHQPQVQEVPQAEALIPQHILQHIPHSVNQEVSQTSNQMFEPHYSSV
ncbi:hypothetical protein AALO_G00097220, partial [Alosa alosa]